MPEFEYTYHDWSDDTLYPAAATRLARLNKHLAEVAALMLPDSSGTDHSVSITGLQKHYKELLAERKMLQDEVGAGSYSPFQRIRRVRG